MSPAVQPIVSIPKPCSESWEAMKPLDGGQRFCNVCAHAVTDFTGWEPDAILSYLRARQGQKVCGRFDTKYVAQLPKIEATPEEVVRYISFANFSWMQKVAAILVICVSLSLASCSTATTGKVPAGITALDTPARTAAAPEVSADTIIHPQPPPVHPQAMKGEAMMEPPLMGAPMEVSPVVQPDTPPEPIPVPDPPPPTTLGGPMEIIEPEPPAPTTGGAVVPLETEQKDPVHKTMGKPMLNRHKDR